MPTDMDVEAQTVWDRVVGSDSTGLIRAADADVLRAYCESVARYQYASRALAQSGPLVRGPRGDLVRNPLHQVVVDNADKIRQFAYALGLSPAGRERAERERRLAIELAGGRHKGADKGADK
jgi:P27 family predicted phage terminase small subunit